MSRRHNSPRKGISKDTHREKDPYARENHSGRWVCLDNENQAADPGRVALNLIKTHQANASANGRRKRIEDIYGRI
jgi:hypothetical protein